ncbi:hypothetical protein KX729_17645 [Rhizobium sp. XQZ8]|uniref:hypothetical protein n=1 Tax=Rhizobium populisoli TaxID=2859785 RepID=UPI001CA4B880|nr:hypothetical protein [Rhizobium populisoli]MBW6423284.1 hypothetical protein [Rhizobium populisoli]
MTGKIGTGKTEAATVRDFERNDIEAVARLFQKTFRGSKTQSPALMAHLADVFFDHPWNEPDIRSKVFVEANGAITGFVGIFSSRLELEGRPLRAAFASSLMVENPKENPLAGARLVRAFLNGPQDISLTETANQTAMNLLQKSGNPLDPAYSLNWLRVLRPASTAVQLAERRVGAARILRPFGRVADRLMYFGRKVPFSSGENSKIKFKDVTPDVFGNALLSLKDLYPLRPRWDEASIRWFIEQAEQKRNFGYPEWRVGYSADNRPLAAYAYFTNPGGIGWVLQALSTPALTGDLVDDLFAHAYEMGTAALRGAAHPWLIPALMTRRSFFHSRSFYVAAARDKSLLEPIRSGQALVSGIAGEGWMRLIGDRFD